jgi:hypothetical protein
MQATIADIRRGDRFTWNNREWIAVYDAYPATAAYIDDDRFYVLPAVPAVKAKEVDGVHEITTAIGADVVLHTAAVTIHERDLPVHTRQDDVHETAPLEHAESALKFIVDAREAAHRAVEQRDEEFNARVRQFLASGGSVAVAVEKTGLSRARIYQIRDGRR